MMAVWDRARPPSAASAAAAPQRGWLGVAATPRPGGLVARLPAPRVPAPMLRGTTLADRVMLPYGSSVGVWRLGAVAAAAARAEREEAVVAPAASVWEGLAPGPGEDLVCVSAWEGARSGRPRAGVVWGRASVRAAVGVRVVCGGMLGAVVRLGGGEEEGADEEAGVQEDVSV